MNRWEHLEDAFRLLEHASEGTAALERTRNQGDNEGVDASGEVVGDNSIREEEAVAGIRIAEGMGDMAAVGSSLVSEAVVDEQLKPSRGWLPLGLMRRRSRAGSSEQTASWTREEGLGRRTSSVQWGWSTLPLPCPSSGSAP